MTYTKETLVISTPSEKLLNAVEKLRTYKRTVREAAQHEARRVFSSCHIVVMQASYSIVQRENEYRILLTSVNTEVLPKHIQEAISSRDIDISELIIERISGESTIGQDCPGRGRHRCWKSHPSRRSDA